MPFIKVRCRRCGAVFWYQADYNYVVFRGTCINPSCRAGSHFLEILEQYEPG